MHGELSVKGGNSGFTSNYSDYCGDGGGGGIIHITSPDISFSNQSAVNYSGGRGLENGLTGLLSLFCTYLMATFAVILCTCLPIGLFIA